MNASAEELVDLVGEFVRRVEGRSLTHTERVQVAALLDRIDEARTQLALTLASPEARRLRSAFVRVTQPIGRPS